MSDQSEAVDEDPFEDELGRGEALAKIHEIEQENAEPCETCETSHDPNKPCGGRWKRREP